MMADSVKMQALFQGITYRVARTKEELEQAYRLVYLEYARQGYVRENNTQMRYSLHNALPQTTTFVALIDEVVSATVTVIPDSPLKMPMDELYHRELDELRLGDKRLCEVSMLASSSDLFGEGVPMLLNAKKMFLIFFLFKQIFDYVRLKLAADYICITVNPKHANTYDSLLFKDLGGLKYYDKVNGAPAVAKYLELDAVDDQCLNAGRKSLYKMFFAGKPNPENFVDKFEFQPEDLKYFFADMQDCFKDARAEEIRHLKECYMGYDFSQISSLF